MGMVPQQVAYWSGLSDQVGDIDAIICDLWGVIHDGVQVDTAAVQAIVEARAAGIKTVFLTNAPRPRGAVRQQLQDLAVPDALLDEIVTSGGLARDVIRRDFAGKRMYHMGSLEDHHLTVAGLPAVLVDDLSDADVILATDIETMPLDAHRPLFAPLIARGVPFICANPDKIVHVGDQLIYCAGAAADIYEDMGGLVHWFGKPVPVSYTASLAQIGYDGPLDRVLMIGDSLRTDITGANTLGLKSLLLSSGIHRDDLAGVEADISADDFAQRVAPQTALPTALMNGLKW